MINLPESGTVSVDGTNIGTGPYTGFVDPNNPITVIALPTAGYVFDHWTLNNQPLTNAELATLTFTLSATDTLMAYFTVLEVRAILIPTAFSPNGDGVNDEFRIMGNDIKAASLEVFDRWGKKVFESDNPTIGWDGMVKGKVAEMGTYVYHAVVTNMNDEQVLKKGYVVLLK